MSGASRLPLWTWLVIASGIGLAALVMFDLRRSLRRQDQRAAQVAARDAQRGARELRTALATRGVLNRIAPERRFEFREGALLVPAKLGSLDPAPRFDPRASMDLVAQDHLQRAERAQAEDAGALWDSLLADPTLGGAARAWVTARMAWFAQRRGAAAGRDRLLLELDANAPAQVAGSVMLLCVEAGIPPPTWARAGLLRANFAQVQPILERLAERGSDVREERAECARIRDHRATLRVARTFEALLSAATRPEVRQAGDELLIFFPALDHKLAPGAGALLGFDELQAVVASLEQTGLDGAPPLALGGLLASGDGGATLVEGFASVVPRPVLSTGLAAGSSGLAFLSLALTALCGGGALLVLRGAHREAQVARLRSEFLIGVTHELKTPLTGIRLTADLLLDGHINDPESRRKHLGRLAGEALRLGVLIENVLDLGRMERGERSQHPQPTELVEFTRETLALFEPLAAQAGIKLTCEAEPQTIQAMVDRDALRQALLNVLDNARKYAGASERIAVSLSESVHGIRLALRDFGPGVAAHERELIFERFRRAAQQLDGSVPGVGLGLYLARELLRRQAGDLVCMDPPAGGPGACFELRLPRSPRGERA